MRGIMKKYLKNVVFEMITDNCEFHRCSLNSDKIEGCKLLINQIVGGTVLLTKKESKALFNFLKKTMAIE